MTDTNTSTQTEVTLKESFQGNQGGEPPDLNNNLEPNLPSEAPHENSVQNLSGEGGETAPTRKKTAAMLRMIGAPLIDLEEAKRLAEKDVSSENLQMKEADKPLDNNLKQEIIIDSNDLPTIDSELLDAANEESFSLESFDSLLHAARASNKAFLLARVTTVDPSNLTRLYYSHYAGHNINKVIFRTQPEEGLLHRMKSRNPLNNMLIVGDVHYFAVTPQEFDRAWEVRAHIMEQRNVIRSSFNDLGPVSRCKSMLHKRSMSENTSLRTSTVSLPDVNRIKRQLDWAVLEEENESIPVVYEAEYFASDDDFLMRSDIREFFKSNSVGLDDYQLFQLHRPSNHPFDLPVLGPDGRPLMNGSNAIPISQARRPRTARHLLGLLDDGDHKSLLDGFYLGYLSPAGFIIVMIVFGVGGMAGTMMFFSDSFLWITAGIIFCIFMAFIAILFVRWTDVGVPPGRVARTRANRS